MKSAESYSSVHSILHSASRLVMGILNATPDSFFAGSRMQTEREIACRANQIIEEGGQIIDVGAFSTRPGAQNVSEEEELSRLEKALRIVRREQPNAQVSVDTFRPDIARHCVEVLGANIINDVSECGRFTNYGSTSQNHRSDMPAEISSQVLAMAKTIAHLRVPYILMSQRATMDEILQTSAEEIEELKALGASHIIIDPGFGFGKTTEQNYAVLDRLEELKILNCPILVGLSRKRMTYLPTGGTPDEALAATVALNAIALKHGANILRVHDVKAATDILNQESAAPSSALHSSQQ